jgi:hypothetical protein
MRHLCEEDSENLPAPGDVRNANLNLAVEAARSAQR